MMHTLLDQQRLAFGQAIRGGDTQRAYRIARYIKFLIERDGI